MTKVILEADPDEQKNLVNDPEHALLHRALKDRLMEQMIRQDYPVPSPLERAEAFLKLEKNERWGTHLQIGRRRNVGQA